MQHGRWEPMCNRGGVTWEPMCSRGNGTAIHLSQSTNLQNRGAAAAAAARLDPTAIDTAEVGSGVNLQSIRSDLRSCRTEEQQARRALEAAAVDTAEAGPASVLNHIAVKVDPGRHGRICAWQPGPKVKSGRNSSPQIFLPIATRGGRGWDIGGHGAAGWPVARSGESRVQARRRRPFPEMSAVLAGRVPSVRRAGGRGLKGEKVGRGILDLVGRASLLHGSSAPTRALAAAGLPVHLAHGAVQKLIESIGTKARRFS